MKTVHAPLALDWLASVFPSARIVVILRHPANVLSSWLAMSLPDRDRRLDACPAVRDRYLQPWDAAAPGEDPLDRAAWQVALLTAALVDATQRHPSWLTVSHEDLCQAPVPRFRELATTLQLPFDDRTVDFLEASDRPGDGFAIQRRASDLPDAWRDRLDTQAKRSLGRQLARFPGLDRWVDDLR